MTRRIRQLIPTKFATAYRTNHGEGEEVEPYDPEFCTWWMVWGKCFAIKRTAI